MSCTRISLIGSNIMTKLKIINVGPVDWFSPHFCPPCKYFDTLTYDPLRSCESLEEFCKKHSPDVLLIYRGDLVRSSLAKLKNIYQIEFSSEIYPSNIFTTDFAEYVASKKFLHCMKDINLMGNIFHYDQSREMFFRALGIDMRFRTLPVDFSYFHYHLERDIDLLFFGRASLRRSKIFSGLKESGLKFVWIENGLNWKELSGYISRAKLVINVTAEEIDNFEPRILLGLAGGARVVTEGSIGLNIFLKSHPNFYQYVKVMQKPSSDLILKAFDEFQKTDVTDGIDPKETEFLSTESFLKAYFRLL